MAIIWFGVARTRFPGPPIGAAAVAARAAEIAAEEQALGASLKTRIPGGRAPGEHSKKGWKASCLPALFAAQKLAC